MSFKRYLNETESVDIDYTPTKRLGENDFDGFSIDDEDDVDSDFENITKEELFDILEEFDDELFDMILIALNSYYSGQFFYATKESLLNKIPNLNHLDFVEHAEIIGSVIADTVDNILLDDSDTFQRNLFEQCADILKELADEDKEGDKAKLNRLAESIVNVTHTKELRRNRKRSSWKRQAILRARYRKTGEGKRERKKALKYLKKYRKVKKTKLKRYASVYNKKWGNNTKN